MNEEIAETVLLREYTLELHNKNAAIFAGAGLSMASGYVDWKSLLRTIVLDLGLDPEVETDLVTLAQYHCNRTGGKGKLTQTIVNHFSAMKRPSRNHELLASLPITTYWTTNYDKLIETALVNSMKVPDVKYTVKQLASTRLDRDVAVYKMHGDVDHSHDAIICKDDYESYLTKMRPFVEALRGDLIEKTFLFLGFSFTDPNIDYILSRVRVEYERHQRHHYCVQKRVTISDGETSNDFEHRVVKQQLFLADLKRFGIQTVLVDRYSDITSLLEKMCNIYRKSSIFIAGSAHEYSPFRPSDAQEFVHELARVLSSNKNRIITGFGLGVGSAVINGTLANLKEMNKTATDEDLVMRPFPQFASSGMSLANHWTEYRQEMIRQSGIAIFLFGNKLTLDSKLVDANGMQEEFAICIQNGVVPIPVGATGYVAKQLWDQVMADPKQYYPNSDLTNLHPLLSSIGDPATPLEKLIGCIERCVKFFREPQSSPAATQ